MQRSTYALASAIAVCGTVHHASAVPSYNIKDITPAGYTSGVAYDVNASGDAVGIATKFVSGSPVNHYFIYDHSAGTSTVFGVGTVVPRGAIVGTGYRQAAINDSGIVAGTAMFVGGAAERRGFIYNGSTITNLGTFFQGAGTGSNIRPASDALDINASGLATGTASSGAATSDNLDIYTATAAPITDIDGDITALTKRDFGRAINNAGLIAGSNELSKATIYSGASETVVVAGTSIAGDSSEAVDLNEVGQSVVQNNTTQRAFRYDTTGSTLLAIPSLAPSSGGLRTFGKGINEDGDVVGSGDRSGGLSGQARGFVYLDDDAATYILEDFTIFTGSTTPGLSDWERLRTAWAINDDGWIVGTGDRRFDGETFPNSRAYILIPVPEPGSAALLILGASALIRRRRA